MRGYSCGACAMAMAVAALAASPLASPAPITGNSVPPAYSTTFVPFVEVAKQPSPVLLIEEVLWTYGTYGHWEWYCPGQWDLEDDWQDDDIPCSHNSDAYAEGTVHVCVIEACAKARVRCGLIIGHSAHSPMSAGVAVDDFSDLQVWRVEEDAPETSVTNNISVKAKPSFKIRVSVNEDQANCEAKGLMYIEPTSLVNARAKAVGAAKRSTQPLSASTASFSGTLPSGGSVNVQVPFSISVGQGTETYAPSDDKSDSLAIDSESVMFWGHCQANANAFENAPWDQGGACMSNVYESYPGFEMICRSSDGAYLWLRYGWNEN